MRSGVLSIQLNAGYVRAKHAYCIRTWRLGLRATLVACQTLACEKNRFSSLLAAGDLSRGGSSATQRQKFHTDEVKSVRNPVRSADWQTEQLYCFRYCLRMTDKKATRVNCKRDESITKQSMTVEYILLQKKHLCFAGARSLNTTLYQNRPVKKT